MMSFKVWAKKQDYKGTPMGDFIEDLKQDKDFPTKKDAHSIICYLLNINACEGAMDAFTQLYLRYLEYMISIETYGYDG